MAREVRIVLSSAGRRVELMNCFRRDAEALGLVPVVVALDRAPELSAACALADISYAVPPCSDPAFIPRVLEIAEKEQADLIVPTIDTELAAYAEAADVFAATGAWVSVPGPDTVAVARDKQLTAQVLAGARIPAPATASLRSYLATPGRWPCPLLLKPVDGSSSMGIHLIQSPRQLAAFGLDPERYIVQEFCKGAEYTVNMYFARTGELLCAIPHRRLETRAGEVSKGRTERLASLRHIAERMGVVLPSPRGALCYQAIVDLEGNTMVFEINARFGGGFPLAHAAGAKFTRWLLEEATGLRSTANDEWRSGVTMLRYDAAVMIGQDDGR